MGGASAVVALGKPESHSSAPASLSLRAAAKLAPTMDGRGQDQPGTQVKSEETVWMEQG